MYVCNILQVVFYIYLYVHLLSILLGENEDEDFCSYTCTGSCLDQLCYSNGYASTIFQTVTLKDCKLSSVLLFAFCGQKKCSSEFKVYSVTMEAENTMFYNEQDTPPHPSTCTAHVTKCKVQKSFFKNVEGCRNGSAKNHRN